MKKGFMRNNWIGFGMTVAVLLSLSLVSGLSQKQRRTQPFMRQKLNYCEAILEGITLEKYDLVVSNSTLLRNMDLTNAFLALKNPNYLKSMTNFQGKVDGLIKAAKEKSLERSTEEYSQVVSSCVACHKLFRSEQLQQRGSVSK